MKILVLNYEYPPIGGGAGNQTKEIIEALLKRGHEIVLISSHFKNLPLLEIHDKLTLIRVPVFRKKADSSTFLQMSLYIINAFPIAFYYTFLKKIELIHAHFILPCGFIAYLLKKLLKCPYLVTAHGGDIPSHQENQTKHLFKFFKKSAQKVIDKADYLHSISYNLTDLLIKDYLINEKKLLTIENSINFIKTPNKIISKPVRFLFIGRISPEKNLDFILEAFKEIKLNYNFTIIGGGNDDFINQYIMKNQLQDKIQFLGWQDKSQIKKYLIISHYLILHSSAEGLSRAGLEANMYGLPIIGSDIKGLTYFVKNDYNGWLSPLKDKEKFVKLLSTLCEDTTHYCQISDNCKNHIQENYNIASKILVLENIYKRMTSQGVDS